MSFFRRCFEMVKLEESESALQCIQWNFVFFFSYGVAVVHLTKKSIANKHDGPMDLVT